MILEVPPKLGPPDFTIFPKKVSGTVLTTLVSVVSKHYFVHMDKLIEKPDKVGGVWGKHPIRKQPQSGPLMVINSQTDNLQMPQIKGQIRQTYSLPRLGKGVREGAGHSPRGITKLLTRYLYWLLIGHKIWRPPLELR